MVGVVQIQSLEKAGLLSVLRFLHSLVQIDLHQHIYKLCVVFAAVVDIVLCYFHSLGEVLQAGLSFNVFAPPKILFIEATFCLDSHVFRVYAFEALGDLHRTGRGVACRSRKLRSLYIVEPLKQ